MFYATLRIVVSVGNSLLCS